MYIFNTLGSYLNSSHDNFGYMRVHSQKEEHEEEADGPELRQRHHGCSLRVGDEGQTWT